MVNTLGIMTITSGEYFSKSLVKDESSAKMYTGPINIERLKLTLQDANGYPLNLHYMDWECVLEIEQMYQ